MTRITFNVPDEPRYENAAATAMPSAPLFPDRSALELVTVAQQEFDVGHDREWAATLWAATQKTFLDLAKAKSIDSVDLIDIAESLDQEDDGRVLYYAGKLINGLTLREHSQSGSLEGYWHEDVHKSTVIFIRDCYAAAA